MLRCQRLIHAAFVFAAFCVATQTVDSQEPDRETLITERFVEVLLRRPRPGTALDRVYGFHVQSGTLDELISRLKTEASQAEADEAGSGGAHQMLVGLLELQRGNDAAAAEAMAQAESSLNDDAMASFYLGQSLLLVGKTKSAAEAFERAIAREPARNEAIKVFTELGRLYQRTQQADKALSVWTKLEARFPGDARVGEQIARTLSDEGEYEAALQRYKKLADQSSGSDYRSVGYRIAAADLKRRMGNRDEAIQDLESILDRLRPSSWLYSDVRRRIEAGFLRNGDYVALADYYANLVEAKPDEVDLRIRWGQALAQGGRINEAADALEETVKLAPENTELRLNLIDIWKKAGKHSEAQTHLQVLVEQDPTNPDYLVGLGNVILDDPSVEQATRRQQAAAAWQRLAEVRKDDAVVTAQVADLMRRIERSDDAIALYRRAIDLKPNQPQYREYLGEYLHQLDRTDEAMEVWSSIASESRANRDNFIRLAEVLNTFDFKKRALEAMDKGCKLDPTFANRLRYAELLARAERYDTALAQLELAESIAETPDEREQLLAARISVYGDSGTLDERIASARTTTEQSPSSDGYRKLALMLEAAARLDEATTAIQEALEISPDDIPSLSVAAELYRTASRFGEAVTMFRRLAETDVRFLPNYLRRIASIQMQLGQADSAMATIDELIAAQPGNPEPYRIYAQQCFQVGRDREGIEKLRRSLRVAPRDADSKRALASALADRFRTDEAIELHWQLLDGTDELDEQQGTIASLATLYDRKGDFDRLVNRLELRGREASDMRSATLLTAMAHRATGDMGAARQSLEPLLAENPRDAELLTQMVTLSEAAGEPSIALDYQQQLTDLADTAENRRKILTLLIDTGQADKAEAAVGRLQALDDDLAIVGMIDRAIRQDDRSTAIRLCRAAMAKRSDLWEIQVRLAALLVASGNEEEGLRIADAVDALDIPSSTQSASGAALAERQRNAQQNVGNLTQSQVAAQAMHRATMSRLSRAQNTYRIASFFRVGQYANFYVGGSMSSPISPYDFGHAKTLVTAIRLVAAQRSGNLEAVVDELIAPDWETTRDPEVVWKAYDATMLNQMLSQQAFGQSVNSKEQEDVQKLQWRLAELDRDAAVTVAQIILSTRMSWRQQKKLAASGVFTGRNQEIPELTPLEDSQLTLIERAVDEFGSQPGSWRLAAALHDEFVEADMTERANKIVRRYPKEPEDMAAAAAALPFYVSTAAIDVVSDQVAAMHSNLARSIPTLSKQDRQRLIQTISSVVSLDEISDDSKLQAVDLLIATQAASTNSVTRSRSLRSMGTTHANYRVGGRYLGKEIRVPFSDRLLPSRFASQFFQVSQLYDTSAWSERLLEHLASDVSLLAGTAAETQERRVRGVLSAFANLWMDEIEAANDQIVALSDASPEDTDLWIERARMAAELDRPEAALRALDSIHPLDRKTLQIRELAAMNLAAELGETDRAKTAATRLFGMRLDKDTELALVDQLSRLGMDKMATAVLQRSRRRGGQTSSELISIAQRFFASGDAEAAAEVSFEALRKLNARNGNESYYRQQIVQLLQQAGRLEPLLKQAERRVESAPSSMRLKSELADLYTAAGRITDANRVFDEIAAQQPEDPKVLWDTATRLSQAGKQSAALDKFVAAIEKDPSIMRQDFYQMQNAMSSAEDVDKIYRVLTKMETSKFDSYLIRNLSQLYRRYSAEPSDDARAFFSHVLQSAPPNSLGDLLRSFSGSPELLNTPETRDAVARTLDDVSVLSPQSGFWSGSSGSINGQFRGAFDPLVRVIDADDETRNRVRKSLKRHLDGDLSPPLARVVLFTIDARNGDTTAAEYEQMLKPIFADGKAQTPATVWWEVGQVLEATKGFEKVAVTVLEHARDELAKLGDDSQLSALGVRLANAYVVAGEKELARKALYQLFEETDFSEQNQYNPGYGDYRALESASRVATLLLQVEAPLETIRVCSEILSQPQRFEAARRWSGRRPYREQFEKQLDSASRQMRDSDYARFLDVDSSKTEGPLFDLVFLAPTAQVKPERTSIAAMAVHALAKSESGRLQLADFDQRASEILEDSERDLPSRWSLAAMRVMVATVLQPDDAVDRFAQLFELLPPIDDESARGQKDAASLLSLYSPAILALRSHDGEISAQGERLADYVTKLAAITESHEVVHAMALSRLPDSDDPEATAELYRSLLNDTAAKVDPPAVVSKAVADECIKVANLAVNANLGDVALDAMHRGFGGGPPLRSFASAGSAGAFSFTNRNRNVNTRAVQNDLELVTDQLLQIVDRIRNRQGSEGDRLAEPRFQALADIIFPEARVGEVFPYARNLLKSDQIRLDLIRASKPEIPRSLIRELALAVADGGLDAELRQVLDARAGDGLAAFVGNVVLIHLAVENDDRDKAAALLSAMNQIAGASSTTDSEPSDTREPALESPSAKEDGRSAGLVNVAPEVMANLLLHAALSVESEFGAIEQVRVSQKHLLKQASTFKSISEAETTWGSIASRFISDDETTDIEAQSWIDAFMASVRLHYSHYSGGYGTEHAASIQRVLMETAMEAERWDLASNLSDSLAGSWTDNLYFNNPLLGLSMSLSRAEAQQRYDLLSRLVLGMKGEQRVSVASASGLYVDPPSVFAEVVPSLDTARNLPFAHPEFLILSTASQLADAAAQCGRTDELVERLRGRVQEPGDEADAMIGLAYVAAGKLERSAEVLQRVAARLKRTEPSGFGTGKHPYTEAVFVAKSLAVPEHRDQATEAFRSVLTHVIYSQDWGAKGPFFRLRTKLGFGPAPSQPEGSPLKHWIAVQSPYVQFPITSSEPTIYLLDERTIGAADGSDYNVVMLKYPVKGDFVFRNRVANVSLGRFGSHYAGFHVALQLFPTRGEALDLERRQITRFEITEREEEPSNAMAFSGNQVTFKIDGHSIAVFDRSSSMPFLGMSFENFVSPQATDIIFAGDVEIPREVNLLDNTLQGWTSAIVWGYLQPKKRPTSIDQISQQAIAPVQNQRATFVMNDDELVTGDPEYGQYAIGGLRHIHYMRPLLDEESVSYEFFYEAGTVESHPSVGRVALLLRPDGVKLRWLAQAYSVESRSMDPMHEVAPPAVFGDGRPNLIENGWNRVVVTRHGEEASVEVNGVSLCTIPLSHDTRPGFLVEKDYEARIRDAKLTGPWPEKLPANLLELND